MNSQEYRVGSILKRNLSNRLAIKIEDNCNYKIEYIEPSVLINHDRIDIFAKCEYAEMILKKRGHEWPLELYTNHLNIINGFVEADGSGKIGADKFTQAFNRLIRDIELNGYNPDWAVPCNGKEILDGAHRVAVCAALNIKVPTYQIECAAHKINYQLFESRGVSKVYLDYLMVRLVEHMPSIRFAFFWPAGLGLNDCVEDLIKSKCEIILRKKFNISNLGKSNLIRLLYRNEAWIGDEDNGFIGAANKAQWCFGDSDSFEMIALLTDADLVELKGQVRALQNVGKHAIHINDTDNESIEIARCLFNENTFDHLNTAIPRSFAWFSKLANDYSLLLKEQKILVNDCVIVGSAVLAAYGIREIRDVDFLSYNNVTTGYKEIDCHNLEWDDSFMIKDAVIYDPRNYFYYNGLKIVSFDFICNFKLVRSEEKDLVDVELLTSLRRGELVQSGFSFSNFFNYSYLKGRFKFILLKVRYLIYKFIYKIK